MSFPLSIRQKAIGILVVIAAGYVLLNVAVRLLSEGFQPLTQVYMRHALAFFVSLVLFRSQLRVQRLKTIKGRDWLALLLMGVVGYALCVYLITLGALNTKIVNVSVIYATIPFFTYLYSFFLLKKSLNPALIALLLFSFWGVSIVASKSWWPDLGGFGKGEIYMIGAAMAGAWFGVGRKLISDHLNNAEISIIVMGISALTSLSFAMLTGETFTMASFMNWHVLLGLAIGAVFNIVATYGENFAFNHLDAVFGSQILLTDTFFGLVLGYLLYSETIGVLELIGGLMIVASVVLAYKVDKQQ